MYHTFLASTAVTAPGNGESGKPGPSNSSRRISTSNACVECRRRKIRCDGMSPCGQCQWYSQAQLCTYSKPAQRVVPSRKLVDRLQTQVDQSGLIFSRLFPGRDIDTLASMSREELLNLALTLPALSLSPFKASPSIANVPVTVPKSEGAESLDALEQAPDQDPEVDEAKRHRDKVQGISDDVNGLSLSVDRQSSYVGVSSITAALKVIFTTAPVARSFIAQSYPETSRCASPGPQVHDTNPHALPSADVGHKLIESYFTHVHQLMPMIDEDQFWHTYLYGGRRDPPWLALLNMVLALGSLTGSTCDDEEHIMYFQRGRRHLDLGTFGSGNLLVLQALGLLSGYYLHWLNRPNEAYSLMGATLRMATTLGLHREYNQGRASSSSAAPEAYRGNEVPVEIRRRTWWSLVCLDTWASMATGRPSLGRLGPGITVQSPRIPEHMNNSQYLASLRLLPVIHNITFCRIATRVQDKLAEQSLLKMDELLSLDAELVKWHDELPPILQAVSERHAQNSAAGPHAHNPRLSTPGSATVTARHPFDFSQPPDRDSTRCPEILKTPRALMHWWYQILRMLMHRPYVLAVALRRTPHAKTNTDEKVAISKCRIIAAQTIDDIDAMCEDQLLAGWNAVWLMYQAVMVPLVSLFSHLSSHAAHASHTLLPTARLDRDEDADKWSAQIEMAIKFFDRMQRYSVAAMKSKDVVERLYSASKHVRQYYAAFYSQQQLQLSQQDQGVRSSQALHDTPSAPGTYSAPEATNEGGHFRSANGTSNRQFGPPIHTAGPNNDTAMNLFWDDMQWDTFPEMPGPMGSIGLTSGLDQFDWLPMGGGTAGEEMNSQPWNSWNFEDPRQ